jgi:hypothetical protein
LRKRRSKSAYKVKRDVSYMADKVLEIVAKYKKEQHVPEDMAETGVHEHRAEKIEIHWKGCFVMRYLSKLTR